MIGYYPSNIVLNLKTELGFYRIHKMDALDDEIFKQSEFYIARNDQTWEVARGNTIEECKTKLEDYIYEMCKQTIKCIDLKRENKDMLCQQRM